MTGAGPSFHDRRNAQIVHALVGDLATFPSGDRRLRAVRALTIYYLGRARGATILAGVLLRAGVALDEVDRVEAWCLTYASRDDFAINAFLSAISDDGKTTVELYAHYGADRDYRAAVLRRVEWLLTASDLKDIGHWPLAAVWSARVVIDNLVRASRILGRFGVADRLWRVAAEIDRSYFATVPRIEFSPNFFSKIGHAVLARALADLVRAERGESVELRYVETPSDNPWLIDAITSDFAPSASSGRGDGLTVSPMSDWLVPVGPTVTEDGASAWSMIKVTSWAATRWMARSPVARDHRAALAEEVQQFLDAEGIEHGRFLVTLHVRDAGFKGIDYSDGQRNAAIASYDPAIDWIVAQGGVVVRLGDPSMPPLRERPNVIDYARSSAKSGRLDIGLAASCTFHIGTSSGMSFVPFLFGKPILFTNWITLAHMVVTPNTVYLPKPLWHVTGRRAGLREQADVYASGFRTEETEPLGLVFQDNEPHEILDAVQFFLAHLDVASERLQPPADLITEQRATFRAVGIDPAPLVPPQAMDAWTGGG